MRLSEQKIEKALGMPDVKLYVSDIIDSTNKQAKRLIENGVSGRLLIVSDCQTAGVGRQGKSFYSPSSTGIYLSAVTRPNVRINEVLTATAAAGVAVVRAIEKLTDLKPLIKWVNDIYIDDKKVCGILARTVVSSSIVDGLIIGVGINISTTQFPEEITGHAGSLNREIDRNILAAEIAKNIFELTSDTNKSYMNEYRQKSNIIGKEITYYRDSIPHSAFAVDIDNSAGLVVEENGKKITLTGGEISVRVKRD